MLQILRNFMLWRVVLVCYKNYTCMSLRVHSIINYVVTMICKVLTERLTKKLCQIIYTQIWVQNITAIMTIIRSAFQTSIFFDLLGKFDAFDKIYLKVHLAPNKRIQVFYVCYIVFFGTCHLIYLIKVLPISMVIIVRVIVCCLTILSVVHYAVFVRTLRKRYEIANAFFKKYLFNANINAEEIHPVGAEQLFKELRNLTNHVKSYGAINALMFIVESTTIFVSCMSIITIHNIKKNIYMYLFYSIHSIGRLIFFIIFTREIHNTIEESKLTVRIAHEAHSKSINPVKSKQFDAFILNYWNNRITFDVYDLFDIDYKLVQSILTAVAAYAAIFIQIQLTLENKERYSNNSTEKELINR
ncbi:uncharacterized protein LOC126896770 isoform X2 [Daktulosphaira vitifoliae]|uniref:uncharacterized protein LOC126896770 isoform X2 n=1 Tax=Daktulosphaira vitifoliae TaxID=58002 RepID=UPI0021AAC8E1|nr:uncharacterized protein LOC126896770 isoform X2 [Daktulosphaira vitifoliae]